MRRSWSIWSAVFTGMLACSTEKPMNVTWPHGVKYEIFVLAFADGNGDGKGDLKGLTEKLDYVQELGVNGIWLMPIMPSPSYHKYDVTDYKAIHPDYGTLDDFKLFVKEAHARGIHVVVDLILNHTSKQHPWFLEASSGKDSPYRNYYVWADRDSIADEISKKTITLDSDNITQWHAVNDDATEEHYYGFFSSHMPDLNFDNPDVRNECVDIAKFWLDEMKVDGFRFDAAKHIYPDDRAVDSHEFWKWYREELKKIKPDVYLIGEVYSLVADEVVPYTIGLPSLFNFAMGDAITNAIVAGKDAVGLIDKYIDQAELFRSVNRDFLDSPILSNHDQNRIASELGNDISKIKVAASVLLTLPGAPYIYYGEELGMLGMKPDEFIREPFLWGQGSFTTSWTVPRFSTEASVPPLALQEQDRQSVYHHYKTWIAYRNSSKILTYGNILAVGGLPNEVVGLKRTFENQSVLVLHNISDVEVTITLKNELGEFDAIDFSTNAANRLEDATLTLAAYSTVVLEM
jgi:alpha-amylase